MRAFVAVLILAGLAGTLPARALAHGTISPASGPHGTTQSFVVRVPNSSVNVPLTGFRLTPPEGVDIEAEDDPDWTTTTEGRTIVWTGDGVPAGDEGRFRFRARLPDSGEDVTFQAEESYPSVPRSGLFPLEVALTGSASGGSSGSQPVIAGLIVGGVLALAILAALLLPRLRSP